jgi:hypothetical protein
MSTTVEVIKNRLIIKKDGRLVMGNGSYSFHHADTNNRFIVTVIDGGRIILFRLDGRFIKDISATSEGCLVKILPDDTVVWRDGGQEKRCNVSYLFKANTVNPIVNSFKDVHNAEQLGAATSTFLINKFKPLLVAVYNKIKQKS